MNSTLKKSPSWIGVDWGTSNLRVWIMSPEDQSLRLLESSTGMGTLEPGQFEPTLLALIEPFLADDHVMSVVCCGMVGARQGWSDAGYLTTPVNRQARAHAHLVTTVDERIRVLILPGIQQLSPADVMRGEETQIAGLLLQSPSFSGTVCLPGTHTKWVAVAEGTITGFQTCMSGELFGLLSKQSVLRHSMQDDQWSDIAFDQGVAEMLTHPESLTSRLFSLRADNLVNATPGAELRARLSGMLIGTELAGCREYWSDKTVTLVGAAKLTGLYAQAMSALNTDVDLMDGDAMTLSGLVASYRIQQE